MFFQGCKLSDCCERGGRETGPFLGGLTVCKFCSAAELNPVLFICGNFGSVSICVASHLKAFCSSHFPLSEATQVTRERDPCSTSG